MQVIKIGLIAYGALWACLFIVCALIIARYKISRLINHNKSP